MKYSDEQRIAKIVETTEKLSKWISDKSLTREMILEDETIRWTITTPLYNIGEHAYNRQMNSNRVILKSPGLRYLVFDIAWFMIMRIPVGILYVISFLMYFQSFSSNLKISKNRICNSRFYR